MRIGLILVAIVLLSLIVAGVRADGNAWARVIETTAARLTCGDLWLDSVGDRWALGMGDTAIAISLEPYDLLGKFESLCVKR